MVLTSSITMQSSGEDRTMRAGSRCELRKCGVFTGMYREALVLFLLSSKKSTICP